jgi:hypothetical protein
MANGYWVTVTYKAGLIGEKIKYWVPEKPTRSQRKMKADIRKQRQNENNVVRREARVVNENWPSREGFLFLLSYSDEGLRKIAPGYDPDNCETWDETLLAARHQLELFLQRCRRACRKAGLPFRFWGVTSDLEHDPKQQLHLHTRVHHHLIIDESCVEICRKAWKLGHAGEKQLKSEADHYDLVEYLLKQTRRLEANDTVYTASRNLRKPKESAPRVVYSDKEVQAPRGARVLYRSEYKYGRPQYVRYVLPKKDSPTPQADGRAGG